MSNSFHLKLNSGVSKTEEEPIVYIKRALPYLNATGRALLSKLNIKLRHKYNNFLVIVIGLPQVAGRH